MGKVKAWMMEQEELIHEAIGMGLREEEVVEYVKDNMRGQPIDRDYILRYLTQGEDADYFRLEAE